jgi:hypothetical protein
MPPRAPRTPAPVACTLARRESRRPRPPPPTSTPLPSRSRHPHTSPRIPSPTPYLLPPTPLSRPTSFPQHRCRALPPYPNIVVATCGGARFLSRPAVGLGSCRGARPPPPWNVEARSATTPRSSLVGMRGGDGRPDRRSPTECHASCDILIRVVPTTTPAMRGKRRMWQIVGDLRLLPDARSRRSKPHRCREGGPSPAAASEDRRGSPAAAGEDKRGHPAPARPIPHLARCPVPRSCALPHHITEDRHILHCRRSRQQHIIHAVIVTQHRPNFGVAPPPSSSVPPPSVPTFQVPTSSPRHHRRPFHPRAHTHDPQVLCLPSMLPNKLCMSHPSPAPPFHPRPRRPGGKGRRRGAVAPPRWTQEQGQSYT